MSDPASSYEQMALAIALIIWGRCVDEGDGAPCFRHLNENGFDMPADCLARLGLMTEHERGVHVFTSRWRPGDAFRPKRHPGEPTAFDLTLVLMFLMKWDGRAVPRSGDEESVMPPLPDMTSATRFQGPDQLRFERYALGIGAAALARAGLGYHEPDGRFQVIEASDLYDAEDLLDMYPHTRFRIAARLGGEARLYPPQKG